MKKWIIVLFVLSLFASLTFLANGEEAKKAGPGIASGQVVDEDGSPLPGGVVSFFNAENGVAPLLADVHRIPDSVGRMHPDGRFNVKLKPGSYYMGALIITDPGRGPGPPRAGEKFYYARDDKGDLREIAIGTGEEKDFGQIVMALPDTFPAAKNLVTIQGRVLKDDGTPFAGGVLLVKTDMNKQRPDFVSTRTDEAGRYEIKLPADTPFFLLGRERSVGRPSPGSYVGTYGSNKPISLGGVLPVGSARPALPTSGMPAVEGVDIGPGKGLPKTVMGNSGETLTGIDIMMFKIPVPQEQREKLQGTLGFGVNKQGKDKEQKQTAPEPEKDK
ncbi:MAG TPA: carboxypeptidase-like regulatory domain-containing protein [Bacteroidales bacterium]|nr:carboxypeptidase-like regulatory domain-containing protein [Bacteroidales bacterium]